jgi:cytochrome c
MKFGNTENINAKHAAATSNILCAIIGMTTASLMLAAGALATEMPPLAKKHDCNACHDIDARVVGPAWREVSRKYKGAKEYVYSPTGSAAADGKRFPLEEGLVLKVSKGGSGNWGSMPMPGNDLNGAWQGEIRELVKFVLGLEK